jgi:hypothetical protein
MTVYFLNGRRSVSRVPPRPSEIERWTKQEGIVYRFWYFKERTCLIQKLSPSIHFSFEMHKLTLHLPVKIFLDITNTHQYSFTLRFVQYSNKWKYINNSIISTLFNQEIMSIIKHCCVVIMCVINYLNVTCLQHIITRKIDVMFWCVCV